MNIENLIRTKLRLLVKENNENQNYMFFSNLKQLKRQCDMLLEMDELVVNNILNNGHDWADDHITVAKENMDQVFDFFMNETKNEDNEDIMNESKKAQQAATAINMKKKGIKPKNQFEEEIDESENCPTDPKKWSASKAAAKKKFDVYPSAYANSWAAKNYKAKGGGWKKCK